MKISNALDDQELDDEQTRLETIQAAFRLFRKTLKLLLKIGGSNDSRDYIEDAIERLIELEPNYRTWHDSIVHARLDDQDA